MSLLDKVKGLFGGAAQKTGDLADKAGDAAEDAFEKVEDVADRAADRFRGEDEPADETPPSGPPA